MSTVPVKSSHGSSTNDDEAPSSASAHKSSSPARPRVSVACFMCQKRKIKCDGVYPCENCRRRNWSCRFNAAADGRRTAANRQAMMQQMASTLTQIQHHKDLIAGILAIIREGDTDSTGRLMELIRNTQDLTELDAFVRDEVKSDPAIEKAFHTIDWQPTQLGSDGWSQTPEDSSGNEQESARTKNQKRPADTKLHGRIT
ncbi:hypothetical protein ABEF95_008137 [Exophiala dermatitidis]